MGTFEPSHRATWSHLVPDSVIQRQGNLAGQLRLASLTTGALRSGLKPALQEYQNGYPSSD
jgi:hypothetical protein